MLALVLGLFLFFRTTRGADDPAGIAPARAPGPAEAPPALVHESALVEPSTPSETAARTPELVASVAEVPATPRRPSSAAEIRGRFVLEGGAPAPGVSIAVHGWGANQERKLKYGIPEGWEDPSAESDADGRFAIRFEPPRAFQFTLEAKLAGYPAASWSWSEILPGEVKDLGETVLQRGGAIEGRIVKADGSPLLGQSWTVYAENANRFWFSGRDSARGNDLVDPGTASFRIEDMPPGAIALRADSDLSGWIDGPTVTVVADQTVSADIVYRGPDNPRRITVTTSTRPFYVLSNPEPSSIKLYAARSEPRSAANIEDSSQSYAFDDLEPGLYAIEIDDPHYLPWRQDGVAPGTEVRAELEGSSALVLEVVDAESGKPVGLYSVHVAFRNVQFFPREFEVHDGKSPLAGGLLKGMFPGDFTVSVRAEDRSASVDVYGLQAGETRAVAVRLGAGPRLSGRVARSNGDPVAGASIQLLTPAQVDDSAKSPILDRNSMSSDESRHRKEIDSTTSDEQGRFRFDLARAGAYVLRACSGPWVETISEVLSVSDGERKEVELTLSGGGSVRGRIRGPDGASYAGLRVWVRPEGGSSGPQAWFQDLRRAQAPGVDGS